MVNAQIISEGGYTTDDGTVVVVGPALEAAVSGTVSHPPDGLIDVPHMATSHGTLFEVTAEGSLQAARRLHLAGAARIAVLNFASARNPGGGYLGGAKAQEEDIARSSALYACQCTVPEYYEHHRANRDLRYSDRVIYAPGVPVFRDQKMRLLDRPYRMAMLVAAAPNMGAIQLNRPELATSVPEVMRSRTRRVLRVAAAHGHRRLVLGAWGCGAFGNDPEMVADVFANALREVAAFDHVVFAVLDRIPTTPTLRAFASRFS